ncbi:MAG: hypothetical protein WCA04_04710 [Geobacteraceae bacterium]
MLVTCVNCSQVGNLADYKISSSGSIIKCQNCNATIKVFKETYKEFELATALYRHRLYEQAKIALITLACGDPADFVTAKARYLLGEVAYTMKQYDVAVEEWKTFIRQYPGMEESAVAQARIAMLQEVAGIAQDSSSTSSLAGAYLKNGDFWSGSANAHVVDHSFLDPLQTAIAWYDRAIKDGSGTATAEMAYARKLYALLGWEKESQVAGSPTTECFGLKKDCNRYADEYAAYLKQFLETFARLEADFPESLYLQGFRLEIAQLYWMAGDRDNARIWLEKMAEAGSDISSLILAAAE